MIVVHILDHLEESLERLLHHESEHTNLIGLITDLIVQVQELEDVGQSLILDTRLSTAKGAQLDALGELVGESRDSRTDEEYRRFIGARIAVRRSQGSTEDLINIASIVTGATAGLIRVLDIPPAGVSIEYILPSPATDEFNTDITRRLNRASAAGVGIKVVESSAAFFGFEGDPDALGFGVGQFARRIS